MRNLICFIFFTILFGRVQVAQAKQIPLYKDSKQPIEKRIDDLLQRMTLEEKIYQLCAWYMAKGSEIYQSSPDLSVEDIRKNILKGYGSISTPARQLSAEKEAELINKIQKIALEETRLGIPLLVGDEALHGAVVKSASCFPQPIGMASTWDLDLIGRVGDVIGKEVKSVGINQVMAPVLDLGREPRHGRFPESFGEDPYLVSLMGGTLIKHIQKLGVACTPKHFVANFVGEGGREGANMELSERALRETHLVPYEYAVKQCGILGIMTAYNAINGIPCTVNSWLLNNILREEWGFRGVVVSDWSSVPHLYTYHRCVESPQEGAVRALKAGMDIDLPHGETYIQLIDAVQQGMLKESELNVSVRRILWLKFHLGLFETPYVSQEEAKRMHEDPTHRELSLETARKSLVLLKNNGVLPIKDTVKRIAVLGPNADAVRLGGYTAFDVESITPLKALKKRFGDDVELIYEKGTGLFDGKPEEMEKALEMVKVADMAILFMGGDGNNNGLASGGETIDRMDLRLMGRQEEFIRKITEAGKPVIVVLVDGRPVVVRDWIDKVDGLVMMWYAGEEGGNAIADLLKGTYNPSGKLPCTFPKSTGQCPLYYSYYPMGRAGSTAELGGGSSNKRYDPQYPFGFGLSYTTFEYGKPDITGNGSLTPTISIEVKNAGKIAGEEVVQLYVSSKGNRIVRPVKELKAFKRIHLNPGESKQIDFTLSPSDFMFLNEKMEPEVDEGEYEILVGTNSKEGVKAELIVEKQR